MEAPEEWIEARQKTDDALIAAKDRIRELESDLADYKSTHKYTYIAELEKQDVLQIQRIAELEGLIGPDGVNYVQLERSNLNERIRELEARIAELEEAVDERLADNANLEAKVLLAQKRIAELEARPPYEIGAG